AAEAGRQLTDPITNRALRIELGSSGKGQHAPELAGQAAEHVAEPRRAEDVADGAAEPRAELLEEVADRALRHELLLLLLRKLRAGGERQHAAERAGEIAEHAAELRLAEHAAEGAAELRRELLEEAADSPLRHELLLRILLRELLLRELRTRGEWQHAAELPGEAAEHIAELALTEHATDGAAELRRQLMDPISDRPLRRELRHSILLPAELRARGERQQAGQLAGEPAESAAHHRQPERRAEHGAERRCCASDRVADRSLRSKRLLSITIATCPVSCPIHDRL